MSRNLPHLFIRNQQGLSRKFDMSRKVDNDQVDPKPAESYRPQKDRLNLSYRRFDQERAARWRQRSLEVPANIDYVEIQFYIVFGDARIRSRFESEFGLAPVRYNDFNKTILFAISDEIKFRKFVDLLYQFIQSPDNIPPRGTDYSIISTVHDFQFLSREKIIGFCRNHLVLDLVNIHRNILNEYDQIKPALFGYLSTLQEEGRILGFQTDEDTSIEVHGINNEDLFRLADNFDILCTAHSLRIPRIQSDVFNAGKLSWGITIRSIRAGTVLAY